MKYVCQYKQAYHHIAIGINIIDHGDLKELWLFLSLYCTIEGCENPVKLLHNKIQ